jgi:ABC-type sugar transport system substrate-binding protein
MTNIRSCFAGGFALLAVVSCAPGLTQTPPPGPTAQSGRTVAFIASDFRNGGVMGVYRGFEEASQKLGWQIRLEDGRGLKATQGAILAHSGAAESDTMDRFWWL